eukprot:1138272-Pelagomonas_calceolata.AAC.7
MKNFAAKTLITGQYLWEQHQNLMIICQRECACNSPELTICYLNCLPPARLLCWIYSKSRSRILAKQQYGMQRVCKPAMTSAISSSFTNGVPMDVPMV